MNKQLNYFFQKTIPLDQACIYVPDFKTGLIYVCKYVYLVGADNYYMPYEAKVQAINKNGKGPITESAIIMSAEACKTTFS